MTEPDLSEPAAPTRHPGHPDPGQPADDQPADDQLIEPSDAADVDTGQRQQLTAALSGTVLEAAARRLADAIADYDAALDRHAFMPELRQLDQEVARAERDHAAAAGRQPVDRTETGHRAL